VKIRIRHLRRPATLVAIPLGVLAVGVLALFLAPELVRGWTPAGRAYTAPGATSTEVATTRPFVMPGALIMPDTADCAACHLKTDGTVGVNPIPAIAHPLDGWTNCAACHSNERLVAVAQGHGGIPTNECLVCHTSTTAAAPARPTHVTADAQCMSCHGSAVSLPAAMATRPTTTCWLCHRAPTSTSSTSPATAGPNTANEGVLVWALQP